jgi:hypothetical protein
MTETETEKEKVAEKEKVVEKEKEKGEAEMARRKAFNWQFIGIDPEENELTVSKWSKEQVGGWLKSVDLDALVDVSLFVSLFIIYLPSFSFPPSFFPSFPLAFFFIIPFFIYLLGLFVFVSDN